MNGSSRPFRLFVPLFLAVAALILYSPNVAAQIGATSSIAGQVVDQSGGVVVGATVTITDSATKAVRTQDTNDVGRYIFTNVQPGTYDMAVTKTGFQTNRIASQQVIIGTPLTLNFTLKVGESSQTVEVISTPGAELQTSNATTGTSIGGASLLLLPSIARDATALVTYQAATSPGGQVAGQETDQNTFMIDGANNSQDMDGGNNTYLAGFGGSVNGTVPTPQESVEELKVNTSGQTADFYSSAGGQVQLVTKRGSDSFHGSAYDYYQADWLDANTFANNAVGNPQVKQHQNRFGGALGGPLVPKSYLGGKTYFFVNYEGRRFPQSGALLRTVPTDLMRAGVLDYKDDAGNKVFYNLNPTAVTVGGNTYMPGASYDATHATLDPRNIGLNSYVNQIWTKWMPHANYVSTGDNVNTQGFRANYSSPITDDTGVARVDHDLGQKWHLMGSYRMYKLSTLSTTQVDMGGFLPGDTLGTYFLTAPRPAEPSLLVVGFTGQLTPNITNDFHWNYTRNDWQWASAAAPPQFPGTIPAALEIGGETSNALIPMNVNTQNARQRVWDGHDYYYKDDMSWLHGNHFIQFGGQVNRNFDYHQRDDNGAGTFAHTVYQISSGNVFFPWDAAGAARTGYMPAVCPTTSGDATANCLPQSKEGQYAGLMADILGFVNQPQVLLTRSGANLALQSLGTSMFDQSTIMTYDAYFNDTWHIKPSVTLSFGLNYGVQMPPSEANGKQVSLVDSSGNFVVPEDYLANRYNAAINGNFSSPSFNPVLGYSTVGNVGAGRKYPYSPYYKGFGPRFSVAWNPAFDGGWKEKLFGHNSSVIRGGYSRIFTRNNGVDLVLVPLLGVGLGQSVTCIDPTSSSQTDAASICAGKQGADPNTIFRIGSDGNSIAPSIFPVSAPTLSQPIFPGVGTTPGVTDTLMLDPTFRPGATDQFNFSIQRTLPKSFLMEVGFVGIRAKNLYGGLNIDAVPWMSTVNGQSFAQAYATVEQEILNGNPVTPQNFFEGSINPTNCAGFTSCTAWLVSSTGHKQAGNFGVQDVSSIWASLGGVSSCGTNVQCFNTSVFPAFNPATGAGGTMAGLNQFNSAYFASSLGWSNYNAAYISIQKRATNGLTINANLTYSHALNTINNGQAYNGESPASPWNIGWDYNDAPFDQRFVFNLIGLYQLPFGKGQNGVLGRVIGGWSLAPIFTWRTGQPVFVVNGTGDEYGNGFSESFTSQAILMGGQAALANLDTGVHFNTIQGSGIGDNGNASNGAGNYGVNMFSNASAAYALFRPPILGVDTTGGGNGGAFRAPNNWNLDFTVAKEIKIREQIGMNISMQMFNALNHVNWCTQSGQFNPCGFNLQDPSNFGVLGPSDNARVIELGLRVHF